MPTQAAAKAPSLDKRLIVQYQSDLATLDPATGGDWSNWTVIQSVFDGLMDFKPGTMEPVPDLAESFDISEDGLSYTFHLRRGVKFHNGREMKAADVKYSLERSAYIGTLSPGAAYFTGIVGADRFQAGSADSISGITTPADDLVKIELIAPDATLLHILALNFSYVVPKEEVERLGDDFGRKPVGTGAFKVTNWIPGQELVLERNVNYHKPGIPRLDKITFQFGMDPESALLSVLKGESDIAGDGVPALTFADTTTDPAITNLVARQDLLNTSFIAMNVNVPPFDKIAVRQAVNMAINKDVIVRLGNNRAVTANQPLPPAMPGHDDSYQGYPYDVAGAKAKMKEAGLAGGFETTLYAINVDPQPKIAAAIQDDLAAIGIKLNLRLFDRSDVIAAGGQWGKAPMIWSGGIAWTAGLPDPADFYISMLSCAAAVPRGWNWSWYCNKDLERRAAATNAMSDPAENQARILDWRNIFADLMKDAPWVPVLHETMVGFRSKNLSSSHGPLADPLHIPVNYDEVYVTDGS